MSTNTKKLVKNVPARSYLAKDRNAFLAELLLYARTFFPDKISDFSEASVGGLFMDFAAFAGDNLSYYLDHQFHELNIETAVETKNIQRHIRTAGVKITGASPAVVDITFSVTISAVLNGTKYVPKESDLPVLLEGTVVLANNGTRFELTEELDFSSKDRSGNFVAKIIVDSVTSSGIPETFIMQMTGECISGSRTQETFVIENVFIPFRTITLAGENITEIISVSDSEGNRYYEVDNLSQDVVFQGMPNLDEDGDLVKDSLSIIPAPYRYVKNMSFDTKLVSLGFGGGNASDLDSDIIGDPSEFALPLYGKKTFSRFTIDPGSLLRTQTLGISPVGTTISVEYRSGGGLLHNVASQTIRGIEKLLIKFPNTPTASAASAVRASLDVINLDNASGGEQAPTLQELQAKVPAYRNAQARIVTKEDLLTRVYTMPSNFGRVFRAGIRSNPINPLASQLFIISRNAENKLIPSPDTLKKNLSTYLNQFRMISDAIDILDAQVIDISISFNVAVEPSANKNLVVQNIILKLQNYFDIKNWQIDQVIQISDVGNLIYNTDNVVSLINLEFSTLTGFVDNKEYSDIKFNIKSATRKNLIIGPPGSIFFIRYPELDIFGSAI